MKKIFQIFKMAKWAHRLVPQGRQKVTHPFRGGMAESSEGVPEGRQNSHSSFVFISGPSAKALGYLLSSLRDFFTFLRGTFFFSSNFFLSSAS